MQVELNRVQWPMALPVVRQLDLYGFIALIHTVCIQVLNTGILGKGDVRSYVEDEACFILNRCGMAAVIAILVVHRWRDAFGMQPVRGPKPSHSRAKDDDVWFCHKVSPKSYCEVKSPEKHSKFFGIDRRTLAYGRWISILMKLESGTILRFKPVITRIRRVYAKVE